MSSPISSSSAFYFFSSLVFLFLRFLTDADMPYLSACLSPSNYANGSTYSTNLDHLLFSLPSSASAKATGYADGTIGQAPDIVYGLAQCRGDSIGDKCHDCFNTAREGLLNACRSRSAFVCYDRCFLRYSDEQISSSPDILHSAYGWDGRDAADQDQSKTILDWMLNDLIPRVISAPADAPLYATSVKNFTGFQTVYGLGQCMNNLVRRDCRTCLEGIVDMLSNTTFGRLGAAVFGPNCNVRFETHKFYDDLALSAAPPPASVPPTTNATTRSKGRSSRTTTIIAIAVPLAVVLLLFLAIAFCFLRRSKKLPLTANPLGGIAAPIDCVDQGVEGNESVQFDLESVRAATDNFSEENKLGEGGFGAVYKGGLSDGRQIAVKRLSCNSRQGVAEFKTEAELVAKLQHRNLVRLLGFCAEGQEKLLIYEYVPNTSLDKFLFDPTKRESLDWDTRYRIIGGIARGLLYLHEDSPLKIFHRDLKASNVLLDAKMNPKISDFGLAKIVGEETHITVTRIAGTFGYMAPEYAAHGKFSAKSDVFSFGVLMLETVTGRKNSSFYESDGAEFLLSYAWERWKDGRCLEVVDPTIRESCSRDEAMRCIQIALLCVQDDVAARPTISVVVLMLGSSSITLPAPSKPAFSISSRMAPNTTTEINSQTNETNECWDEAIVVNLGTNESK